VDIKRQSRKAARKCCCELYIRTKQRCSRKRKRRNYEDSPTAHTPYLKVAFEIENALEVHYGLATCKNGATGIWPGERFDGKLAAAWRFKCKAHKAFHGSGQNP
jgi:hypothetical protein